jgi:transmembrane sensor
MTRYSLTIVTPNAVRAEAAAWLARLRADDRQIADEAAFRDWLDASPVHAAAFEAVDRMWSDVGWLVDLRRGTARHCK